MEKKNALHEDLHRGLEERHIQLIALGGAIGVGLFLGSGAAIKTAGPSLMLVYFLAGIIMFYIMRALGEVAVAYPVSGTFSAHANIFLGPLNGWLDILVYVGSYLYGRNYCSGGLCYLLAARSAPMDSCIIGSSCHDKC